MIREIQIYELKVMPWWEDASQMVVGSNPDVDKWLFLINVHKVFMYDKIVAEIYNYISELYNVSIVYMYQIYPAFEWSFKKCSSEPSLM